MTITYLDGTVLEAIVISHEENEIRAIAAGCGDVLAFTRIHGTWISEEIEPVAIEFAWQRRRKPPVTSEDDCVCPKELAACLIESLFRGCEAKGSWVRRTRCLQRSGKPRRRPSVRTAT